MKAITPLVVLIFSILAAGCSTTPESTAPAIMNYTPSSTMKLEGNLKVGSFRYLPSENNSAIKPNQVKNTAVGAILFDRNVTEFFETALYSEAKLTGIKVDNSSNVVSGEIIEYLIDDFGFDVDWTLKVRYLISKNNNSTCHQQVYEIKKNTAKFSNQRGSFDEIIKLNIEKAFEDPLFISCISK